MARNPEDWLGLELAGARYRVNAKLGEGGMGFIYKAHDGNLDTDVVIKVPRLSMLVERQFIQRFTREMRSLVNLSHPHIVKIIDVGRQDKIPFAVMQYLGGGDLADRLQNGVASLASLAGWLPDIAKALDFVHEKGYVHRDVKPGNILFDEQGHAYLSDFGVAKVISETADIKQSGGLTGTGMVLGTPDYLAPEVAVGEPFDGRADQYSLAVTVYEVVSGRRPYAGATPGAVMIERATKEPPPLQSLRADLPAAFCQTVHRGLGKAPEHRFASCSELADSAIAAVGQNRLAGTVASGSSKAQHTAVGRASALPSALPPVPLQTTDTVRQSDESSKVSTTVSPTVGAKTDAVRVAKTARAIFLGSLRAGDQILRRISGEDNAIIHNFLRAAVSIGIVGLAMTLVFFITGKERYGWDQRIANYTEAIRLKPDYVEAYYYRGNAYYNKGDYDRAVADCTEAIRLKPDYVEAYYYRGNAYYNKGDYDRAVADCTEAIRLKPDCVEAYYSRGNAYRAKGDYDQAAADCTEAIRLKPDYAEAYYSRGNAYRAKGAFAQAAADCTEAIRLKPDYAEAYCGRGWLYVEAYCGGGSLWLDPGVAFDRAVADYTEAIRLRPDYAEAYCGRGFVYNSKGDHRERGFLKSDRDEESFYDQAVADYTEAIRLQPDYAEAYEQRAHTYDSKGNTSMAESDRAKYRLLSRSKD